MWTGMSRGRGLPAHVTPGNSGNSGRKKGRNGRKPNAFKAQLRELGSSEKAIVALRVLLENPSHPHHMAARRFLATYGVCPIETVAAFRTHDRSAK